MIKTNWERIAAMLFVILCGIVAAYAFFRYLFGALFPFLLAWGLVACLRPFAARVAVRLRISKKLCCVALFVSVLLLGGWGLWWSVLCLLRELNDFLSYLLETGTVLNFWEELQTWLESLFTKWGIAMQDTPSLGEMIGGLLSTLSTSIPGMVASLVSFLPTALFMVIVTVISGFYFCVDGERIGGAVLTLVPQWIHVRLCKIGCEAKRLIRHYVDVYLKLMGVTFFVLLVGLMVLRVEYAFLLSFLISVCDLLPIIGVGSALIPWSIFSFLQKDFYMGFGLLILYLVVGLVRQVLEPHLIGKSLGVHPFLSLFVAYVGFCLYGVVGMFLAPVVIVLIKSLAENRLQYQKNGDRQR